MADRTLTYRVAVDANSARDAGRKIKAALQGELKSISIQGAATGGTSSRGGMGGLSGSLLGAIPGGSALMGLGTAAGIAGLAVGAGKAAIELGNLGQQLNRQAAYFEVWSGGVAKAAENLDAMKGAIGGAATESEMMLAANKYLSMGLAKNSDDLAKLSKMAVLLGGDTRTASEAMEEFALLLANQSILRLDTFGISGAKVRERIDELTSATKGLSRESAFMTAVMEVGTQKVAALEAAGISAAGGARELSSAWAELRNEIAKGLGEPVSELQSGLAETAKWVTNLLKGTDSAALDNAEMTLAAAKQHLKEMEESGSRLQQYFARINASGAQAEVDALKLEIENARRAAANLGIAGADSMAAIEQGAIAATGAVALLKKTSWNIQGVNTVGPKQNMGWGTPWQAIGEGNKTSMVDYATAAVNKRNEQFLDEWKETQRAAQRLGEQTADKAQSAWEQAVDEMASYFTSEIEGGINALKGLVPGGYTDPTEDPNGPFRDMRRLLDVAVNAEKSPWASELGVAQADAKRITDQFMAGMVGPEQQRFIDMDMLAQNAQAAQAAQQSQAAFSAQMLSQYGVNMTGGIPGISAGAISGASGGAVGATEGITVDLRSSALDSLRNLEGDKEMGAAAGRVGRFAAQQMASGWLEEIGQTSWALSLETAIIDDILQVFSGQTAGGKQ